MTNAHDPYLTTVKRTLNEEEIKKRKQKVENRQVQKKGFLSQSISLNDYIYLPESLQKPFLISIFILLPYIFGILILFTIVGYEVFKNGKIFTFDIFMLRWTVGYESLALILLLLIFKSAFSFRKR